MPVPLGARDRAEPSKQLQASGDLAGSSSRRWLLASQRGPRSVQPRRQPTIELLAQRFEYRSQRWSVGAREEVLGCRGQRVAMRRFSDAAALDMKLHEAGLTQCREVDPDRIAAGADSFGQLDGGRRSAAQLGEQSSSRFAEYGVGSGLVCRSLSHRVGEPFNNRLVGISIAGQRRVRPPVEGIRT